MDIDYVQIINSFVSTEGSDGIMTNYVYYTLLVVFKNGTRQIVEGKLNQVSYLLPFVRTPMDDLRMLQQSVKDLHGEIDAVIDKKFRLTIESLFPIPDIQGMNEVEALESIRQAGLEPVCLNRYPRGTPKDGIVREYRRNKDNFKKVDVRIVHVLPRVDGLHEAEALSELRRAGFNMTVEYQLRTDIENGIVVDLSRDCEDTLEVKLTVSRSIPETTGMRAEEAVRMLTEAGCHVKLQDAFLEKGEDGTVLRWWEISADEVGLDVIRMRRSNASRVSVTWTETADSPGDAYEAKASFDWEQKKLYIYVYCTIHSKAKHQVNDLQSKAAIDQESVRLRGFPVLEPGERTDISIEVQYSNTIENLPRQVSFTLETQYGMLRKKEDIQLQLNFEW